MSSGHAWSKDLQSLTRQMMESGDALPKADELCFKNIDGRSATMSLGDYWGRQLRLMERGTGRETLFPDVDALLSAGWAVD